MSPERKDDLVALFAKSLRLLGQAGQPVAASRLGARAWWLLKDADPAGAEHVNGVMHYLATLPPENDTATPDATTRSPHDDTGLPGRAANPPA